MPVQISNRTILLGCLNWGNGHVSRSIGLIKELQLSGNRVIFAGDESQQVIMRSYFPEMKTLLVDGYPFQFKDKGNFAADLYASRSELMGHVRKEHDLVEQILRDEPSIDLIISDHRYGFFSERVESVFITHQVKLAIRWFQFPAQYIHRMLMSPFKSIWIMDTPDSALAGKLSNAPKGRDYKYIGHYSRFETNIAGDKTLNIGVVNGPSPYSDKLFNELLENPNLDKIIVPEAFYYKSLDGRLVNAKDWKEVDEWFYRAKSIYSYCGYSTLMDIQKLGCDGILKPTPRQLEQEYLYQLHYKN